MAKSRGAAVVVDRGSSHIAFQRRLLLAEHERWNLGWTPTPDWIVEREEAEYEIADRILVPSTFALESFVECGVDEAKIRVVPYGVDLRLFHPAAKHDDVFRVIFVGQLSVRKGLPDLLDALTPILTSKLELWLVGPNAPETASILRRSPGSYVVVGPVPRAKLHWYISQASVLVLPSIEEGMALVQAQALACGVPIIGTHNSGASDLIGNSGAGSVIAIHDPAAIRGAVLELRDRPDLQASQADAALTRAAALAGWGVYGERIVDVYREVVA